MRRWFEYGGVAASVILIAFGIGSIVIGIQGRSEVRDYIARENIVATADATKITNGKLKAGEQVTTGAEAKQFANVMRYHTLETTRGQTYAEMGRFLDENGKPTNDEAKAAKDARTGQPVENGLRNLWVTETALATALNTSFFAEQVAQFAIVMGVALLLTGIGFLILTVLGVLKAAEVAKTAPVKAATPAPSV